MSRVTIKDVAEACGVVPSTVSNALTGKRYVRPETREHILTVAHQLGFQASSAGRGFRLGRSWSVGLLVADVTNPWFPEIVRGAEDALWREGITLILCNTDYRTEKEERYIEQLIDRRIDGVILASVAATGAGITGLVRANIPLVMLNRRHDQIATDFVGMDNAGGIGQAVDHLTQLGHRRIGFIAGRSDSSAARERLDGFRTWCPQGLVVQGDYSIPSGRAAAETLLTDVKGLTAIICANDFMAYGAVEAVQARGLHVPQDVSVIGFDDIFVSALPAVDLTTVRPQTRRLGEAAADCILSRISGQDALASPRDITLETSLVVRGTTAPARPEHARRKP